MPLPIGGLNARADTLFCYFVLALTLKGLPASLERSV